LAEVIKYGLINDPEFFDWLEQNMPRLTARDQALLAEAIERSCQDKADVVASDELEQGVRALLNLGHTFGHAIETGMGYGNWLHGEAISVGMVMAADLSQRMGWLQDADVARIKALLVAAGLPVLAPKGITSEQFMTLMSVDKKNQDGHIRLVLLRGIGQAIISDDYSVTKLADTLESFER
jgi:3-dehydroquinate synthase